MIQCFLLWKISLKKNKTTEKITKEIKDTPLAPVQEKERKGIFIDHKTKIPEGPASPIPKIKGKKKTSTVKLEKEVTNKTKPIKQTKKRKSEKVKHSDKTPKKNLDESFKKRQEKLSDMLNNKDEGQVT